ncbi:hypothetical protein GpartN1_g4316.t1 [Galdieria partita]|uniref:Uncharacterized protein n=1 Tax=Galdieria partita TaxID=83374 RepID=A0A9C7PYW9_9RHOD|nr:hypothetical protein GpartN1_g4227.t1 [Galdieria partita]GJQ12525.1 hypothetical protein GpartN1_g4316.t1 [Galdieria partita]
MSGWNNSGNNYPSGTDNNSGQGQGNNKTKKSSGELAKDGLKGLGMAALSAGKLVYRGGKWCVDKVENAVEDHKSKGSKSGGGSSGGYSR